MVDVVTYFSTNAKHGEQWVAYVVLPDGNYWGVRFSGETEGVAKDKAIRLYENEKAKFAKQDAATGEPVKSSSDGRGHHFSGKVWMINRTTHDLKRINPSEEAVYTANGYVRGGPRSK